MKLMDESPCQSESMVVPPSRELVHHMAVRYRHLAAWADEELLAGRLVRAEKLSLEAEALRRQLRLACR